MYLVSYLPVAAHLNGVNINRFIEFDSRDPTKYVKELKGITLEILNDTKSTNGVQRAKCIDTLKTSILRINEFWMEKIFLPLSLDCNLPDDCACRCIRGYCRYDLFRCSHFEPFGAKVKVDIFARAPSISVNCGNQTEEDVDKLKEYYRYTIRRYQAMPCCGCLPISKKLLSILETMIMVTKLTLNNLLESLDDVDSIAVI